MTIRHSKSQPLIPRVNTLVEVGPGGQTSTQSRIYIIIDQRALRWRHNGRDGISNHQPHDCLLNRLFRRRSKKTSKLRVTGLWVGNSPVPQMASNAENVSISWRHDETSKVCICIMPISSVPQRHARNEHLEGTYIGPFKRKCVDESSHCSFR